MNDVGGSESGNGLRAVKSSRTSDANFEYDDSEWDVGIGNLIIDLDADIEKNNEASRSSTTTTTTTTTVTSTISTTAGSTTCTPSSTTTTRTTSATSSSQMHIPQSHSISGNTLTTSTTSSTTSGGNINKGKASTSSSGGSKSGTTGISVDSVATTTGNSLISISMDHSGSSGVGGEKGLKMKIKRTKPGTKSVDAKHEIVKSDVVSTSSSLLGGTCVGVMASSGVNPTTKSSINDGGQGAKSSHKGDERDGGGGNESCGGKIKPPKRGTGSTHKKLKSGVSPIPLGISPNKKDRNSGGTETSNSTNTNTKGIFTPTGGITGGGNVKDMYNVNVSIPNVSVSVGGSGSGPGSAFVKATMNSGIKGPVQGQQTSDGLIGGCYDLMMGSNRSYGNNNNNNNNNTMTTNSSGNGQFGLNNLTSGNFSSPVVSSSSSGTITGLSPGKGEKGQISPSVSVVNTTIANVEKLTGGTNSPSSYSKKPRVFIQPDKNKWIQEDNGGTTTGGMAQNLTGTATSPPDGTTTSNYRSLNTGNLNSNNNNNNIIINSGSGDSSTIIHSGGGGGPVVPTGINNFGECPKETAVVKPQAIRTSPPMCQDACVGTCVGTVTEPDCLGPCEPGTSVTLEGIVWHETESGVLVVNVTWRGKTYVGTLLDCTKNDWASPRFCDSPTSDLDIRNQKNRGKRGRAQAGTPVSDSGAQDNAKPSASKLRNGAKGRRGSASASAAFVTPISPLKDPWLKRKTRGSENESQEESSSSGSNSVMATMAAAAAAAATHSVAKATKRLKLSSKDGLNFGRRTNSPGLTSTAGGTGENSNSNSPVLIECPEPNCQKKYKHINGLRYHQSHAHSSHFTPEQDSDSNMSTASTTNSVTVGGNTIETLGVPATAATTTATVTTTATTTTSVIVDPTEEDNTAANCDDSQVTLTGGEDSAVSASSTPSTTPVKKQPNVVKPLDELIVNSNVECDLTVVAAGIMGKERDLPEMIVPLTVPSTQPSLNKVKEEKMEVSVVKESQVAQTVTTTTPPPLPSQPQIASRPAILTVPNVPFMSLQNRGGLNMPGMLTVPRIMGQDHIQGQGQGQGPLVLTKSSRDTETNMMSKTGPLGSGLAKSVPWQPHAHSMSTAPPLGHGHTLGHQHTAHVISSLHPQSASAPLTVPQPQSQLNKEQLGNKDGKHQSSPNSAGALLTGSGKKPKHKKKNKDKGDRDREGKGSRERDRERDGVKGQSGSSNVFQAGSSSLSGRAKFRDERKGSFEGVMGEDGHCGMGGENREDPQSPAYSDISDANDSGPESDMSLKDSGGSGPKTTAPIPELKKDAVATGGHGMSPFYPAFFSPYSLDSSPTSAPVGQSQNTSSSSTVKDRHAPAPQSEESASTLPPEKGNSGKTGGISGKPVPAPNTGAGSSHPLGPLHAHTHPSHGHGLLHGQHPEERRTSPKIDYHPKYLPQQHYYPYPYSNYHFDQPPYGLGLSDNPYAHSRVFMDDKERERELQQQQQHGEAAHQMQQQQRNRGDSSASKRRSSGDIREDTGGGGLGLPTSIKQEPEFEQRTGRGHKDQRHAEGRGLGHSQPDPKSDFGVDFSETPISMNAKRNSGVGISSHRQSSSASKRDREREERHARMKEAEGKESSQKGRGGQGDGPTSGRHGHGHKGPADLSTGATENDKEKDQGSKPTMETQGPPPPPTAGQYAYIPQGYLPGNPFALSFDPTHPLYRQVLVPGPYPGPPYGMHGGGMPRFPQNQGNTPLPEDLSRPSGSGAGGPGAKALDLLQHHAAQYYASQHKIHELHERAMKSPSPQVGSGVGTNMNPGPVGSSTGGIGSQPPGGPGLATKPSSPCGLGIGIGTTLGRNTGQTGGGTTGTSKPADLSSKDIKPPMGSLASAILGNESCRSPPTQHHVHSHTHHHTHVGIGYPIIPTVPPQYSPHYGVLSSPSPATTATVIPPFPSQKPN